MKKLGIYVNKNKDRDLKTTQAIVDCAEKIGFTCQLILDTKSVDVLLVQKQEVDFLEDKDAVVVLGGDGTILRIAAAAAKAQIPLLSINLGHLGFLTELELGEIEDGLKQFFKGDFTIETRMML